MSTYWEETMKKLAAIAITILVSSYTFADASSGFSKDSAQLKALGSAFKSDAHATVTPSFNSNDITMGYAGEDVSDKINTAEQYSL